MPSGIFSATITSLVNGTTASASDVMASLNSIRSNGVNNDSATIQTNGSGDIFTPKGQLRNVSFLGSLFALTTNPTVNSGSTSALTVAGGATGVPTTAYAVIITATITSATVGAFGLVGPHGVSLTGWVQVGNVQVTNQFVSAQVIVPFLTNQIDVKASGGNIVLQSWFIVGYVA